MGQESLCQLDHYRKANRVRLLPQEARPCPKQGGPEIPLRPHRNFPIQEQLAALLLAGLLFLLPDILGVVIKV